jgi:hypothetical protein
MRSPSEASALAQATRLLGGWLDAPEIRAEPRVRAEHHVLQPDLVIEHGKLRMVVEYKASGDAAAVGHAIEQAKRYATALGKSTLPIVATSFMGPVGQRLCDEADVSWFDISGNAHIVGPGLRIIVEGKPNRFARRGRPSTAFAPKSARIARTLLIDADGEVRQKELARLAALDDGFTSRIVRRLEQDGLITRTDGLVRVPNPDLLLDAWEEVYDFEKHGIVRGHVTARSGEDLLSRFASTLEGARIPYAATGLTGAWLLTGFAAFRLVTIFVKELPPDEVLGTLGFREESKGANTWLVVPNDEGVFHGASKAKRINCVHPIQAYLDLGGHPERAKEAAAEIRARLLRWKA